jgi:hypothetical protein
MGRLPPQPPTNLGQNAASSLVRTLPKSRLPPSWASARLASHGHEKGQLEKTEVETLAAYAKALGGKLKFIADFGDESYVLG